MLIVLTVLIVFNIVFIGFIEDLKKYRYSFTDNLKARDASATEKSPVRLKR